MNIRHDQGWNSRKPVFAIAGYVVVIGALSFTNPVHATVIVPVPTGTTTVTPANLPGLPAGDTYIPGATETEPFTGYNAQGQVVFVGTVTSQVFSDPAEPNFAGNPAGLDFVYQLSNNPGNVVINGTVGAGDPIDRLAISSFVGFQTDVDYIDYVSGSNVGIVPTTADRNATPGATVGFNFLLPSAGGYGMVTPGMSSDYLVIETDASTFVQGTASVIDGGSGYTNSDAPVATTILTVPEPATFGLLTLVGGMLLGRRRR